MTSIFIKILRIAAYFVLGGIASAFIVFVIYFGSFPKDALTDEVPTSFYLAIIIWLFLWVFILRQGIKDVRAGSPHHHIVLTPSILSFFVWFHHRMQHASVPIVLLVLNIILSLFGWWVTPYVISDPFEKMPILVGVLALGFGFLFILGMFLYIYFLVSSLLAYLIIQAWLRQHHLGEQGDITRGVAGITAVLIFLASYAMLFLTKGGEGYGLFVIGAVLFYIPIYTIFSYIVAKIFVSFYKTFPSRAISVLSYLQLPLMIHLIYKIILVISIGAAFKTYY